jgi:Zn-finger nucleic acid-binding protein/ribosomal protein L40E
VRHLVTCGGCRRQLDAGDRAPGELLRCACGAPVAVPAVEAHDSAVVRCSACGAPRAAGEAACRYCGSSFTVHERDLDTICPGCMARVSGEARFCSHCGSPILVDQAVASATPMPCPACGAGRELASRQFAGEPVAISECVLCGGMWTDKTVFEFLVARAHHAQLGAAALAPRERQAAGGAGAAAPGSAASVAGNHLYRPCPVCGKLMNRQNFGRKSGVIVDVCAPHGLWFDLDELPRVLGWVQGGGEERSRQLDDEEAAAAARQRRLAEPALPLGALGASGERDWSRAADDADTVATLLGLLGDGVRRLFHRS